MLNLRIDKNPYVIIYR